MFLAATLQVSCGDGGYNDDEINPNSTIAGSWVLLKIYGEAWCDNGTFPGNASNMVSSKYPAEMASYNKIYKFNLNGTCVMDGDNGTFTIEDRTLIVKTGSNQTTYTVRFVGSEPLLELDMDEESSKKYAIEVIDALLAESGDSKTSKDYDINVAYASFAFLLDKQ